ncbi:MAG TPA: GGDEF domain-containing protein, partial [Burkholderiaceae bacterium]|nr:GGDEF domain-containing protein [Burkholderiaceae bacterium]
AFTLETARAARYGTPLSLALLDLDNFKQLNDTFGHAGGDRALVHLAQTLHALLRPTDLIARIGGEEFAVLLPAATLVNAAATIERIQSELRDRPLESEGSHGTRITLEFSAGVGAWRAGEALEALLMRADAAMYAAKRAGKNCVIRDP